MAFETQRTAKRLMRKAQVAATLAGLFVLVLIARSGRFLVVDRPRKSDVIVVLGKRHEAC